MFLASPDALEVMLVTESLTGRKLTKLDDENYQSYLVIKAN